MKFKSKKGKCHSTSLYLLLILWQYRMDINMKKHTQKKAYIFIAVISMLCTILLPILTFHPWTSVAGAGIGTILSCLFVNRKQPLIDKPAFIRLFFTSIFLLPLLFYILSALIIYVSISFQLSNSHLKTVGHLYTQEEQQCLEYKQDTYFQVADSGSCSYVREEKSFGKAGALQLYFLKNDYNHDYIVGYSFREGYVFSKKEKKLPQEGSVTGIYIENTVNYNPEDLYISDAKIIAALCSLETQTGEPYSFSNDGCGSFSTAIHYCYKHCPIANDYNFKRIAHLADGRWVYVTQFNSDTRMNIGFVIEDNSVIEILEQLSANITSW